MLSIISFNRKIIASRIVEFTISYENNGKRRFLRSGLDSRIYFPTNIWVNTSNDRLWHRDCLEKERIDFPSLPNVRIAKEAEKR